MAQAVHQGDRLLRTARTMLAAHARLHGDHCSLWVVDGADVVAVACEGEAPAVPEAAGRLGIGRRLAVGIEAGRLPEPAVRGDPELAALAHERCTWTTMFRIALGVDATAGDDAGGRLVASVLPWAPCPLVLTTIERAGDRLARTDEAPGPVHESRHSALARGLAWSLEAVVC